MKVVLGVCTISLLLFSSQGWAHQTHQAHKVKPGETLYRIATINGVTAKALKEANHLPSSLIQPGQLLQIPGKSLKGSGASVSRDEGKKTEEVVDDQKSKNAVRLTNHVVERGENLYRIARRMDMTVKELMRMNHLENKTLQIGQVLVVPSQEEEVADAVEAPADGSTELSLEEGQVAAGDPASSLVHDESAPDDGLDAYLSELSESNPGEGEESSLIYFARKYLGAPYRFGGENPKKGIDCSAFVQRVFRYFSIDLPRTAREQFKAGIKVSKNDLRAGDLIFFRTYARYPSHVGIYMGEGKMIHASSRYKKVTITSVDLPYYKKRFIGVIRVPNAENLLLSQGPPVFNP